MIKAIQLTIANGATPDSSTFKHTISDNGANGELFMSRHSDHFGFWSANMLYIDWNLTKETLSDNDNVLNGNSNTIRGMMIAGIESATDAFPDKNYLALDGSVFKGKGRGYYQSAANAQQEN